MTDTLLGRLSSLSQIVLETADLGLARAHEAQHINLSASGITAAAQSPDHTRLVDAAVQFAQKSVGKGGNRKLVSIHAVARLAIEFAAAMVEQVPGRVSVEVDGRLAHKRRALIDQARRLVGGLVELGVAKRRILVKLPATWEGIEAARTLQAKSDIGCHLTLVFGMHQTAACADAGVTLLSPAVGRITDWHKKNDGVEGYPVDEDPGVKATLAMRDYLLSHDYDTELMPATFRNIDQVLALAGCPLLSLPPKLLCLLAEKSGPLEAAFDQSAPPSSTIDKLSVDSARFSTMHADDPVAAAKLLAGVRNLSWAVVSQEKQLTAWISERQDEAAETSTLALFKIWDFDGDGFIDREEWNGSDAVFNAIDSNNNGRISLEEMAIALGAPYEHEED